MVSAVHFGAGRIGRGFVGQLLFDAGCRTTFVDADTALVSELHRCGCYPLRLVEADGGTQDRVIENVDALAADDKAAVTDCILHAELLSTAVGVKILPHIAPLLAAGINARVQNNALPINILLCENGWHVAHTMQELLTPLLVPAARAYFQSEVGLVECVVGRMVPAPSADAHYEDALLVVAEDFTELPVNKKQLRGPWPPLPGLVLAEDFDAYEARKLFLHNMGHAALAYAGWQAGHEFIWQCVQDPNVAGLCRAAMTEVQAALAAEYGFDPFALSVFCADLMRRFANRALGDTVARVAADPVRKLGPHERLLRAVRLCEKHGLVAKALRRVIAMALLYDNPADPSAMRLQKMLTRQGHKSV